ncbi:MAG: 50S ribosomal protein L23 [Gammaproteobacteria bacterium]|nr:50S ribosomal protein L23 [Gammaproteobacteria bacterium]
MRSERLLKIILSPHISEKATIATEKFNKYIFKVAKSASKPEIKDAIEHLFSTKVQAVHIVNVKPKKKIFKSIEGKKKGWKKAYVTLEPGQKLDALNIQ